MIGDNGFVQFISSASGAVGNATQIAAGNFDATTRMIDPATDYNDGGADNIITGADRDIVIGGTAGDVIASGAGNDLVFGDHGKIEAIGNNFIDVGLLPLNQTQFNDVFSFMSIATTAGDGGGDDIIYAQAGDDVVIGGQGGDQMFGADGDDDLIGGHNVDLNIGANPDGNFDEQADGGDDIDGGVGYDVILGDNGFVIRRDSGSSSPQFQEHSGPIYGEGGDGTVTGDDRVIGPDGETLVVFDPLGAANPDEEAVVARFITVYDHSDDADDAEHGDDYIAGGAEDDMIFGQLGNDIIQGDGTIDFGGSDTGDNATARLSDRRDDDTNAPISVFRDADGYLVDNKVSADDWAGSGRDGADYIEGGGENDLIFGNLGQDDIVGGSSTMFGLDGGEELRPDGEDLIFGGSGTEIDRNNDASATHGRDADAIAGDNADIYRLVSTTGAYLSFAYDDGYGEQIVVRSVKLIDYTSGGSLFDDDDEPDNGAADEIHGETGDDVIYGMSGNDILYGDAQDDDLIGGWGHDWVSGGTGQDGILGDDGRIYTSRNDSNAEALYGVDGIAAEDLDREITTPGRAQVAIVNVSNALKKEVNITPYYYDVLQNTTPLADAEDADDILFGGWDDDFIHGGFGDDAISGAEAAAETFVVVLDENRNFVLPDGAPISTGWNRPSNPGDGLLFEAVRGGEFGAYDEIDPRRDILATTGEAFILNFSPDDGRPLGQTDVAGNPVFTDGNDTLFGDLGNDWIVGGTGNDTGWGGYGNDLIDMDDRPETADTTDTHPSYEDRAFGGAGRDYLIANTGGDRLIDWTGEFNSYITPFAPFGLATVSRSPSPGVQDFLYDLSRSQGADDTRAGDTDITALDRNGEPEGEIGLVIQKDSDWQNQTGAPDDPQPGNIAGGPRDVLRSASFNSNGGGGNNNNQVDDGTLNAQGFLADSGSWNTSGGRLTVAPEQRGADAVSIWNVGEYLPSYYEITAEIIAEKPINGYKSNAYVIFDYQSPTDFKFAGINISNDKLEIGYRDATGWHVLEQDNAKLRPDRKYDIKVAINGLAVTVLVDNKDVFSLSFEPRIVDGFAYGLNNGFAGLGANNSKASLDNIQLLVLPPDIEPVADEDFNDAGTGFFGETTGNWQTSGGVLTGASDDSTPALALAPLEAGANYVVRLEAEVDRTTGGALVFDYYSQSDYKFVRLSDGGDVEIGYMTASGAVVTEAVSGPLLTPPGSDPDFAKLRITMVAGTVDVTVDGQAVVAEIFFGVTSDGRVGLMSEGTARFGSATLLTNDPLYLDTLLAPSVGSDAIDSLTYDDIALVREEVIARLETAYDLSEEEVALLRGTEIRIEDLDDAIVGRTEEDDTVIVLDTNAAGHGWFVDTTPQDDIEFADGVTTDGIDLISVLSHEFAHILGREHGDDALMSTYIEEGERLIGEGGVVEQTVQTTGVEEPLVEEQVQVVDTPIVSTTAERPTLEEVISAINSSEIVIDVKKGKNRQPPSAYYVYDDETDSFIATDTAPDSSPNPNAAYQLLDNDGSVFAYIDRDGALWTIDDLDENPIGVADPEPDDWIYHGRT